MKLEKLLEIKLETDRFVRRLDEAIMLAKDTPGYIGYKEDTYGYQDISNTRTCGALKRSAMDLKYELTKVL
jgi:hypothetical protein